MRKSTFLWHPFYTIHDHLFHGIYHNLLKLQSFIAATLSTITLLLGTIYTLLHVCTNFLIAVDKQQRSIDDAGKQTRRKTRSGAQKQATRSLRRQMNKKLAAHTLHQCSICQKKLSCRSYLRRHLVSHTGEKPFKCETCQRDFSHRSNLHRHMLTHTGEKPHQCSVCLKSFSQLGHLQCHSLIHPEQHLSSINSGKKIHECHYCHKKFAFASLLRQHLLTHTGEKPFKCKACQRGFSRRNNLNQHMLTHTGEKPHQCTVCQKSFSHLSSLRRHSLIHSGKKTSRESLLSQEVGSTWRPEATPTDTHGWKTFSIYSLFKVIYLPWYITCDSTLMLTITRTNSLQTWFFSGIY